MPEDYLRDLNLPRVMTRRAAAKAAAKILANEAVARLRHLHLPRDLDAFVTADDRSMLRRAGITWTRPRVT